MNATTIGFIRLLENQKLIRILFVVLNILAWAADDRVENNLMQKDNTTTNDNFSKKIYIGIISISIIVNLYYLYVNNLQKNTDSDNNKSQYREIAILLTIIALLIFLYVEVVDPSNSLDESIIY